MLWSRNHHLKIGIRFSLVCITYFLLTEREGHTGRCCPRSFWYGTSEARSVQERLRALFSQYGPELVRVKSTSSLIWNKKIYIAQEKEKPCKKAVSFHLPSNHSPRRFPRFTSRALTLFLMPAGITGKSGPEYWTCNHSTRYKFTSSSHTINNVY